MAKCEQPIRILLIEPDEHLRNLRTKKLMALGHRISALPDPDGAPAVWVPRLYDVVVMNVDGHASISLDWCRRVGRSGPMVVLLGKAPFSLDASFLPALVISEETETAIQEKLAAFLTSMMPSSGRGTHA